MHIQLDKDNADKLLKISNATNRGVGELVNTFLRSIDNVKYFEEIKLEIKPSPDAPKKKVFFKSTRNWVNRF